jgi:hypothetical protein
MIVRTINQDSPHAAAVLRSKLSLLKRAIMRGSTSSFVGSIDILYRRAGGAMNWRGTRFEPAGLAPSRRGRIPQKARCGNQDRSHPQQWRVL